MNLTGKEASFVSKFSHVLMEYVGPDPDDKDAIITRILDGVPYQKMIGKEVSMKDIPSDNKRHVGVKEIMEGYGAKGQTRVLPHRPGDVFMADGVEYDSDRPAEKDGDGQVRRYNMKMTWANALSAPTQSSPDGRPVVTGFGMISGKVFDEPMKVDTANGEETRSHNMKLHLFTLDEHNHYASVYGDDEVLASAAGHAVATPNTCLIVRTVDANGAVADGQLVSSFYDSKAGRAMTEEDALKKIADVIDQRIKPENGHVDFVFGRNYLFSRDASEDYLSDVRARFFPQSESQMPSGLPMVRKVAVTTPAGYDNFVAKVLDYSGAVPVLMMRSEISETHPVLLTDELCESLKAERYQKMASDARERSAKQESAVGDEMVQEPSAPAPAAAPAQGAFRLRK